MSGEKLLGDLGRYVPDALVILDPVDGRVLDANEPAEQLWGYPLAELLTMRVFDVRPETTDIEVMRARVKAAAALTGAHFESEHRRKDGSIVPVEVSARGG